MFIRQSIKKLLFLSRKDKEAGKQQVDNWAVFMAKMKPANVVIAERRKILKALGVYR